MQSFLELNLSPEVLRAITDLGYTTPSPIQAQALPILLGESSDFLGLAATGTGKTAAFSIPLIERIDPKKRAVQGLILCPTRELAMQVTEQVNLLGKYLGIHALPVYGGASYDDQNRGLHRGIPVVVGTPGRICDHIRRGSLKLDSLQVLILDEADEMISMGFKDDLMAILDSVPEGQANTWLFSATMSADVRRVADTYLKSPQQVQVNRTEMVPSNIEQRYYITHEGQKPEVLRKLIDQAEDFYGLVFCQTKALVSDLTMYLMDLGYRVDSLHGDKSQSAREVTMKSFRDRKVKLLICTDVAARGLDVKDVTHVINYSIPRELDSYVHRIGRTARCGKSGVALSLIAPRQRGMIAQIERLTKSTLVEGVVPSRRELGAKKVGSLLSKFQEQEMFPRAMESMSPEWKEVLGTMSAEEIAGRFLALTFPEIFEDREPERTFQREEEKDRGSRGGDRGSRNDRGSSGSSDRRGGPRGAPRGSDRNDRGPRIETRRPVPSRPENSRALSRVDSIVAESASEVRAPKVAAAPKSHPRTEEAAPTPSPAPAKAFGKELKDLVREAMPAREKKPKAAAKATRAVPAERKPAAAAKSLAGGKMPREKRF